MLQYALKPQMAVCWRKNNHDDESIECDTDIMTTSTSFDSAYYCICIFEYCTYGLYIPSDLGLEYLL